MPTTYTPRIWCRFNLHQGGWGTPYLVRVTTTTVIRGDYPRDSTDEIGEEQHQDRTCIHCGIISTARLR